MASIRHWCQYTVNLDNQSPLSLPCGIGMRFTFFVLMLAIRLQMR